MSKLQEIIIAGLYPIPRKASNYREGYIAKGIPATSGEDDIHLRVENNSTWWRVEEDNNDEESEPEDCKVYSNAEESDHDNELSGDCKQKRYWTQIDQPQEFFYTHDNGGIAFSVFYDHVTHKVDVFSFGSTSKVFEAENVKQFIPGMDTGTLPTQEGIPTQFNEGNSILVETKTGHWVHIGNDIRSFELKQPVIRYESPIAGSDCPDPYIITTEFVILVAEEWIKVPFSAFNGNFQDILGVYREQISRHADLCVIPTQIIRDRD